MGRDLSATTVHEELTRIYGIPPRHPPPLNNKADPLDELVYIVMTLMTNEKNADRAYQALRRSFPTWGDTAAADISDLVTLLEPAGLATQKAPRLRQMLRAIGEINGQTTLDFLRRWSTEDVERFLVGFHGIGKKSARCVMMYSLGRPVLPVDTHVYRIARRLGVIEATVTYDAATELIQDIADPELRYDLHVNMVRHGRNVCTARSPKCAICALSHICGSYREGHFSAPPPAPRGRRPRH